MSGVLEAAFPASLKQAAEEIALLIPAAAYAPAHAFAVRVDGDDVEIPRRIYNPEPPSELVVGLVGTRREVLACLYTRHHDGRVRQRHLREIIGLRHPWVAPFVVQLIGEYVVEILDDIRVGLADLDVAGSEASVQYGTFVLRNPAFFELTSQRVASYWDRYYRNRYPTRSDYPGFSLLSSLRRAAAPWRQRPA